jgi:hypothetical protein
MLHKYVGRGSKNWSITEKILGIKNYHEIYLWLKGEM